MKRYRSIIILINVLFLFNSCQNQSVSNTSSITDSPLKKAINSITPTIDTSAQLRFTSMIRSFLEDSQGNFWIGSDREGACRYDGKTFTYFTTKNGMSDDQIRTIQEDQAGNIWFATGNGVNKYDGQQVTIQKAIKPFVANKNSESKWRKDTSDLWFNGEIEGGIYRYHKQQLSVLHFPKLNSDHESFSITGTVTGICVGKNNMLWMANYGGVLGFDGTSFQYINKRGIDYHVRSIFEDSKGHLWIGNNGIGVLRYDGNSTTNFPKEIGVDYNSSYSGGGIKQKRSLNHVFTIAEDRHGNIWFGDRDSGAWRFDGKALINYTVEDGLPNMFVRVIYKDKKDNLWFGMERGNICKFNGKSFDKMF